MNNFKNILSASLLIASLASCQKDYYLEDLIDTKDQLISTLTNVTVLQNTINTLNVENITLKSEIVAFNLEVALLENSIYDLSKTNLVNDSIIASLTADLNAATIAVRALEVEKLYLDLEIAQLVNDVNNLIISGNSDDAEIASLNAAIDDAKAVEALLRAELEVEKLNIKTITEVVVVYSTVVVEVEVTVEGTTPEDAAPIVPVFSFSSDSVDTFTTTTDVVITWELGTPNFKVQQTNPAGNTYTKRSNFENRTTNIGTFGAAGEHIITITDADGTVITKTITITQ